MSSSSLEGSINVDGKVIRIKIEASGEPGTPGPTGEPPKPTEGRAQPEKGGNQDPNTWTVSPMQNDPTKFKVVDNKSINIADGFSSMQSAQSYIAYYKWQKDHPAPVELKAIIASPIQVWQPGNAVQLNGTPSTGNISTYKWEQTGGFGQVPLTDSDKATATFTAPGQFGDYTFRLTVSDNTGKTSSADATVSVMENVPPPSPPQPTTTGNLRMYKPKLGGRILTDVRESGTQGASDGIRYNLTNDRTLVDRESTVWGRVSKQSGNHYSFKIGSHGGEGEGCGLIECTVDWPGSKARLRSEGPHPQYHDCTGGTTENVSAMPMNKDVAIKAVQYKTSGIDSHVDFYYCFDADIAAGKFNWVKMASIDYNKPWPCGIPLLDASGNIVGPSKAQDTMRMNGGYTPAPWKGEIVEIEVVNGKPTPA